MATLESINVEYTTLVGWKTVLQECKNAINKDWHNVTEPTPEKFMRCMEHVDMMRFIRRYTVFFFPFCQMNGNRLLCEVSLEMKVMR